VNLDRVPLRFIKRDDRDADPFFWQLKFFRVCHFGLSFRREEWVEAKSSLSGLRARTKCIWAKRKIRREAKGE